MKPKQNHKRYSSWCADRKAGNRETVGGEGSNLNNNKEFTDAKGYKILMPVCRP